MGVSRRPKAYARTSGEQQADAQTIPSQIAALRERIASDEVLVPPDREFVDDGYSGATLVRPALERLHHFAAAGAIQRIYVHRRTVWRAATPIRSVFWTSGDATASRWSFSTRRSGRARKMTCCCKSKAS